MNSKWYAGQEVWLEAFPNVGAYSGFKKITAIGRKWIQLENGLYRFDAETALVDGGQFASPGRVFASKTDALAFAALEEAWADLRLDMERQRRLPAGVTVSEIERARCLLQVPHTASKERWENEARQRRARKGR